MWRPLDAQELVSAEANLGYASSMLRQRRPMLDEWIAVGLVDPLLAQKAACDMVIRFLRNPDARSNESAGEVSFGNQAAGASGALVVTDDELALITPITVGSPAAGIGTIRIGVGMHDRHAPWDRRRVW